MKNLIFLIIAVAVFISCSKTQTSVRILENSIAAIDTVQTIYYKQDMLRTNPRNIDDTISRYREIYFKKLPTDSIVGAMGHWYMYLYDKENVVFEDIYDGKKLIRKNNRDSAAAVYDLIKYPVYKEKHFWSHNTPYAMQYEFRYALSHPEKFQLTKLTDTVFGEIPCYQLSIKMEDYWTMPGFALKLEPSEGTVSITKYFIDKHNYYPIGMYNVSYSKEQPAQKFFLRQLYYDIKYNLPINEKARFDTVDGILKGFNVREVEP